MADEPHRLASLSSTTEELLAMSPDEHDCLDFKEIVAPLTDEYMAMMANAAALRDEEHATVLVGVAEEKDSATGLTSGRIIGLSGDLHRAAETIAQRASMTKPSPVGIEIFEENVDAAPILRVVIMPTAPPHYDQRGRRATRQHTTTRAMSDEEILRLLEAREKRRYAGVVEETANLMMGDFRVVTDEMLETIERQRYEPDELSRAFQEVLMRIDDLEVLLIDLPRDFDPFDPSSMEGTLASLVNAREMGLMAMAHRIDELSDADVEAIERVVNAPPALWSTSGIDVR